MKKITPANNTAVDRFSNIINGIMMPLTMRMYLNAFLSAPVGVCMALRICAVAKTKVPLAISEGWNCIPKMLIQRCAPLVDCPAMITHNRVAIDTINKKGVAILKYLHPTFNVMIMKKIPMTSIPICLMTGAK